MKLLHWADRLPGDVFLSWHLGDWMSSATRDAELALHAGYPANLPVPSHAGIIGFDDHVIEAWLSLDGENSVAAINPCAKYDDAAKAGTIEVWRPWEYTPAMAGSAYDATISAAINTYISQEIGWPYGWENLLGFEYQALMQKLTGVDVGNPISRSEVCSQGVALYLGKYLAPLVKPALDWAAEIAYDDKRLRAFDPLAARISFLAHQD